MSAPLTTAPAGRRGSIVGFMIALFRFGVRKMLRDQAPEMAAALAYRTIFSLIPILVLSLVIVRAFAPEDGIRYGLQRTMEWTGLSQIRLSAHAEPNEPSPAPLAPAAPDSSFVGPVIPSPSQEVQAALSETIEDFVNRTVERFLSINFGVIAVGGIIVLIYGALSLMIQIEAAFNLICRAASGRRLFSRLVNYWTLLTLGPMGLLLGFLVGDQYQRTLTLLPSWAKWITTPANYALKVGLTWLILVLAYRLMPNTRIRLNAAAIGALMAAILWEFAKGLLTAFVGYLTDPATGGQMAVYGSLALVPLFLLWVYVTWLIVLLGLEVTYAFQTVAAGRHVTAERLDENPIIEPAMGLLMVRAVAERFARGQTSSIVDIAGRVGLSEAVTQRVVDHLMDKGFVLRAQSDKRPDVEVFTLPRPVEQISAGEVLGAMHELAGGLPATDVAGGDVSILRLIRQSQVEALRTLQLLGPVPAPVPSTADRNGAL